MSVDSFGARSTLDIGGASHTIYRLDAVTGAARLPYSLKILLENLLRNEDGQDVTRETIEQLGAWDPETNPGGDLLFTPARVLLQDFTGLPSVADFAAMRDAMQDLGGDVGRVNPLMPSDLVIDHSVIAEITGVPEAALRNSEIELQRNIERYKFLRWGQQAFDGLRVVPPNTGIVHQVNLEYLGKVVGTNESGEAFPDTLVGTDSHTTMINGLGVLGFGVGGIEAHAAMLGQPYSMVTPKMVGVRLDGELPEGATATDLVLTVTELLREHGVVGSFVEFFGPGVAAVPLANRATLGNMTPEYGSTVSMFPIDDETLRYLEFTGRSEDQIALVEAYAKEQGLFHDPNVEPRYTETVVLDLGTVVPSLAGPARPQDRVSLSSSKVVFRETLARFTEPDEPISPAPDPAVEESFPASDAPAAPSATELAPIGDLDADIELAPRAHQPTPVTAPSGETYELDHGAVVIAAITSCTNTSNPSVMLAAGLLARNAVERGLTAKPWVKTSLAPGSKVVMDYYDRAGLVPYLNKLGFNLIGFGCTTCIGNSGPLFPEVSAAVNDADLAVVSVLSGNRNFEGRINPDVKLNYLASPPLVVAYAIAGTMDVDVYREPLGTDADGNDVFLRDIWPSNQEVQSVVEDFVQKEMFTERYASVFEGDENWQNLDVPEGQLFDWDPGSTYVRRPPYFDGMSPEPQPIADVTDARALVMLGDSVTTDHISPAGAIRPDSPAGQWLLDHGVEVKDFNNFGARRGNHEVMIRGTFGNIRLRNRLAPGTEGGVTVHQPSKDETSIYEAAMRYAEEGVPLVVLAGKEYGTGSSRDWAAKGTALLGVKAVLAEAFERIHRTNLIGMGVLPLELLESIEKLGLDGTERFNIVGLEGNDEDLPDTVEVTATPDDGRESIAFPAKVRVDTAVEAAYFRNGGILPYVLRQLYQAS